MKQAEIEFCKGWIAERGPDGMVSADPDVHDWISGANKHDHNIYALRDDDGSKILFMASTRGADLLASYEHALAYDLPIVPDDFEVIDASFSVPMIPCPDCELGRVRVPGLPSLLAVDPDDEVVKTMTCPRCQGKREVEDILEDIGRPLAGLVETLAPAFQALRGAAAADSEREADRSLEWRQLTRKVAAGLVGRRFEIKRPDHDAAPMVEQGVRLLDLGLETDGGLAVTDGSWWVRDIPPAESDGWVTGPDEVYAFLERAHREKVEVEAKAVGGKFRDRVGRVGACDGTRMPVFMGGGWCAIDGRIIDHRGPFDGLAPRITAVRRRVSP